MKFKSELVRRYKAADGTEFETMDGLDAHEKIKLCERLGTYDDDDFMQALCGGELVVGKEVPMRPEVIADILTLASLLRPPRAKKGSKSSGQSEGIPAAANAASTTATENAPTSTAENVGVAAISDAAPSTTHRRKTKENASS